MRSNWLIINCLLIISALHVVWLDLASAYGSVLHKFTDFALSFFHVPCSVQNIITGYFMEDYTTGWQQLDSGLAMGCTISPIQSIMAFEIILRGVRDVVGCIKLPSGFWHHPMPLESHPVVCGDVGCPLCGIIEVSPEYIFSGCKVSLTQGNFR